MTENELMSPIKSVTHKQLHENLTYCEVARMVPMIWGAPGIGKTDVVHDWAEDKSYSLGIKKVTWHKLSRAEKNKLYEDPEERKKVYIVYDNRAASNDSTDDKGIPNITNPDYLVWVQNQAYNIFSFPETRGLLFNDELTLAPTLVQNSMYKMVHDKAVGDISFNSNIFVVCAGNRIQDRAFVQETPLPLKTRMIHFWLVQATPEAQREYFMKIGLDSRVIGFFAAHPNLYFHYKDGSEEFTACTPRTIEFLSDLLKKNNLNFGDHKDAITILACGAVSSYVGNMFAKFLQHTRTIKLDKYLRNPEMVHELDSLDEQYGLITLLVHRFANTTDTDKLLKTIMKIFSNLNEEIGTLMLRMVKNEAPKKFRNSARKIEEVVDIMRQISPIVVKNRKVQ